MRRKRHKFRFGIGHRKFSHGKVYKGVFSTRGGQILQ